MNGNVATKPVNCPSGGAETAAAQTIGIVTVSLDGGGTERVVANLAREFCKRHVVHIFLLSNRVKYDIPEQIKIHYLGEARFGFLRLLIVPLLAWRFTRACRRLGIETVYSFLTRPNYIGTVSRLMGNQARLVISERSYPSIAYAYGRRPLRSWLYKRLIPWLYNNADVVVPNAEAIALDLQKNFGVTQKTVTIPNPLDLDMIEECVNEPVDFSFSRYTYIATGSLTTAKNHRLLIEAFSRLETKDSQLVVMGKGPLEGELRRLISERGLEHRVHLLGFQENPYALLARSDCFVMTSDCEGFPNAIAEALACGLPVIATDCSSGPREILAPRTPVSLQLSMGHAVEEFGILTTVGDANSLVEAMTLMQTSPQLADGFRTKAKQRVASFRTSHIAARFERVAHG